MDANRVKLSAFGGSVRYCEVNDKSHVRLACERSLREAVRWGGGGIIHRGGSLEGFMLDHIS